MTLDETHLLQLLLGLGRAGAFLFAVPVLGGPRVPAVVKVGTGIALAAIAMGRSPAVPYEIETFAGLLVKEVAVGLLLGWGIVLAFAAIQAAGNMVEVQFGFGIGTIMDPFHATETTTVAQLYATLALILFLAVDGHHLLVRLVARSFDLVPVASGISATAAAGGATAMFKTAFVWGLQLAAPLVVASLLVEAGLGLVARAVPQMNVFIVSLPLKVGLGILLIGALVDVQLYGMAEIFRGSVRESLVLLHRMR